MEAIHSLGSLLLLSIMFVFVFAQTDERVHNLQFQLPPLNAAQKGRQGRHSGRLQETEATEGSGAPNVHIQRTINNDSVIQNASSLLLSSGRRNPDGSNTGPSASNEDRLLERAIRMLQQLNDRLTALNALDGQELRRLETIEYRLTKIEVQTQEKGDGIKTELRDMSQRVRQLDWQSSRMEAALEAIKIDINGLKHGQDQIRSFHAQSEENTSGSVKAGINNKLQVMTTTMHTMRAAIRNLNDDCNILKMNITKLSNMTSYMMGLSGQLLTKKHFTNVMLDFKHDFVSPARALPQALPASLNNPSDQSLPQDCWEVQRLGHNTSGIYRIKPYLSSVPFFVYCQLETQGGGWTVVQNRYEGTIDFYQDWHDYKHGFGTIGGEFWLGLEKLHILTNYKVNELLIELEDFNLGKTYAHYSAFAIGTEVEGYPISFLGSYEGDAGDSLVYHAGMKFSTYDMDHDNWQDGNCAESHTGAWWYNGCDTSNLNGRYLNGELPETFEYQGLYWYDWHGPGYSLMKSRISVRSSKHSHSHLTVQDSTLLNNKTTKIQGKKKHLSVHKNTVQPRHANEFDTQQNITEETRNTDLSKEDRPPTTEHTNIEYGHPGLQSDESLPDYEYTTFY